MEILHRKDSLLNDLLNSGENAMHFVHQMSDGLANLQEALLAPPLGLVGIQTSPSTLMENIAGNAWLAHLLRIQ